jgi:hypothetical protein
LAREVDGSDEWKEDWRPPQGTYPMGTCLAYQKSFVVHTQATAQGMHEVHQVEDAFGFWPKNEGSIATGDKPGCSEDGAINCSRARARRLTPSNVKALVRRWQQQNAQTGLRVNTIDSSNPW